MQNIHNLHNINNKTTKIGQGVAPSGIFEEQKILSNHQSQLVLGGFVCKQLSIVLTL